MLLSQAYNRALPLSLACIAIGIASLMMNRKQTLEASFHIAILIALAFGAFRAYFWFFPLGFILEIVFWFFYIKWE